MKKTIAVDFDGTIVEDGSYPEIGKLKEHALRVLNRIVEEGHDIIIWTCREVQEVRGYLDGLEVKYAEINANTPYMMNKWNNNPRKVGVDLYIDDKNLFTHQIEWLEVERELENLGYLMKGKGN